MEQPVRRAAPQPQPEAIDIMAILNVLRARIIWIIIAALLGGFIAMNYTTRFVTPMYQASIRMIVNAKKDVYTNQTIGDVTSAESLVATYSTVIKNNRLLDRVIEELDLNMSWTTLNGMVTVSPVNNTPVINLVVTSADPQLALQLVTTISELAPSLIVDAVEAGSCKVISDPYCSGTPISPNVRNNTMKGALAGGAAVAALFVLLYLLNDNVSSEEDLEEFAGIPVLSTIPIHNKGGKHRHHKGGHHHGTKN